MSDTKRANFKRFSEIATVHGLYRVGHSNGWLPRVSWGLTVTFLIATVIILTTYIVLDHFSYLSFAEMEKVTQNSIEFPSVTVCHANNFKLSAFENRFPGVKEIITKLVESTIHKSLQWKMIISGGYSDVAKGFKSEMLNSTVIKSLSSTPSDFRWKFEDWCTFSMNSLCNDPEDFRDYFYSSTFGFCKTFNPDKKYTQAAPGFPFGLSLRLFMDENDKVPLINDNGAGVIIMVHPQDVYPNPYANGILVPLGHEAYISMQKMEFNRLKSPFRSNCTDGNGIFQIYPGRYTVLNCQYSCYLRYIMEQCGFIDTAYQFHNPKEFAESMKKARKLNLSEVEAGKCINEIIANKGDINIQCNCPPPCHEDKILTKMSYTQWPHPAAAEYYRTLISNFTNRENMTKDEVYHSLVSVKVFFDEIGYQNVRESPRSNIPNVFSQVGGQMGLWIGASVFSLLEGIIFIFYWTISLFKRKMLAKKVETTRITVNAKAVDSMNGFT